MLTGLCSPSARGQGKQVSAFWFCVRGRNSETRRLLGELWIPSFPAWEGDGTRTLPLRDRPARAAFRV